MIKIILNTTVVILLVSCSVSSDLVSQRIDSQEAEAISKEEEKIKETIEIYFEGWMTGDTTKLGTAMHHTCQLKNIKDDDVIIFDRTTYLGFFKPRPRREHAGGEVISINVTDDIAAAKCEIHTMDRLYTDYFNMMKIKDQWYIVDKIATSKLKENK